MKNIKICTPVVGKTLSEFLKNLDKVQEISDMVELRVDQIKNLSVEDLNLIRKKTKKEAIFTCRNKEMILEGFKLGFNFVDIDLALIKDLELSKSLRSRTILSFHNYKKTPNMKELSEVVNNMRKFKVEIIKIAMMVCNDNDLGDLFRLILGKRKNENIIVVGMGERGRLTRTLGPLLGSFLTFASTKYGESAPGQIDINEMKNIYKLLVR